jgi:hypothetical protein
MPVLYKSSQNIRPDAKMPCFLHVGPGSLEVTCSLNWKLVELNSYSFQHVTLCV